MLSLNKSLRYLCVIALSLVISGVFTQINLVNANSQQAEQTAQSTAKIWAKPIQIQGLPNLHKVDDNLYRSAQIKKNALEGLKSLGIYTVISLRQSNKDEKILRNSGITFIHLPVNTWAIGDEEVVEALKAIDAAKTKGSVLVHCKHGADRTGLTIAMYRIIRQGWTREEAKKEMLEGGFGFHSIWKNIIEYIDTVDIQKIKDKVNVR
ncbi:fused DSP-PTPase phosphatase/NAD kinase-like protein [Desulfovibrio litoralis]|uniref:TIGR01244 family protein n=1 Tax=Desulfovibrio litoralis DSM 11393 TaxID=1121455 RepID=A0A1M7TA63_9BACT|nr:dual specificity protein phosphatase family protein [Desulfovibrio litoralis]SHN67635.1 TIGR01244 family protein [Desulfovibrio litoralis DSM 11393]